MASKKSSRSLEVEGLDAYLKRSEKIAFGVALTRWFFKKDERMEISTSPVDQRNISLNGIDLDQYLFPIQKIMLGMRYQLKQKNYIVVNVFQQESIFHFFEDSLPGDNREDLASFRYLGLNATFMLTRDRYRLEGGLRLVPSREQSTIRDNTFKLGHRDYVDYKASERTFVLALSFKS